MVEVKAKGRRWVVLVNGREVWETHSLAMAMNCAEDELADLAV